MKPNKKCLIVFFKVIVKAYMKLQVPVKDSSDGE